MGWTINRLVNQFEAIGVSHSEIRTFGYGFDFDINNQLQSNTRYPQLWVQPLNSQILAGRSNSFIQRNFRLWCYDLERNDEDNRISVWNDTEIILSDIIRLFSYGSKEYKIVNNPILVPFQESFGENVTGYWTEVTIQTAEYTGTCDVPGF